MANGNNVSDLPETRGSEIKGDTTKTVVKESQGVTQYSPKKKTEPEVKEAEWKRAEQAEPPKAAEGAASEKKQRRSVSDVIKTITEAPRRAKERAEEMGESAERKYRETREKPAEARAYRAYQERVQEADQKFREGKISKELYEQRRQKYQKAYEAEKLPLEQRIVRGAIDIGTNLQRGAVGETTSQKAERQYGERVQEINFEFSKGHITEKEREQRVGEAARSFQTIQFNIARGKTKNKFEGGGVLGKFAETYRASPAPKIKPSRGARTTVRQSGGFTGIDFGRLATPAKGGIDFSRANVLGNKNKGSLTGIDFSSPLFRRKK